MYIKDMWPSRKVLSALLSIIFSFELVFTWISPEGKAYNEEVKVKWNAKHENEANQNFALKSRDRLQATMGMYAMKLRSIVKVPLRRR